MPSDIVVFGQHSALQSSTFFEIFKNVEKFKNLTKYSKIWKIQRILRNSKILKNAKKCMTKSQNLF